MSAIYNYIDGKLIKWARRKYKHLKRRKWHSGIAAEIIFTKPHAICTLESLELGV